MWTCTKCSYAYNPLWVEQCDICESRRTPPSLTQPSLITMTKDDPAAALLLPTASTITTATQQPSAKEANMNKFVASRSQHAFEEIAASIVEMPPMASFEQDLEDEDEEQVEADEDDEFNADSGGRDGGGSAVVMEWTCKKCTLVNSHRVKACVVCGGSRLRSISVIEDMTLRKGEFWSCSQCTLKNSLSASACSACKSVRQVPVISGQQTNFRPYTSTPSVGVRPAHHHNRQVLATMTNTPQNNVTVAGGASGGGVTAAASNSLAPPVTRMSRSPSPKQERVNVSGAIPKVNYISNLRIKVSLFYIYVHSVIAPAPYCPRPTTPWPTIIATATQPLCLSRGSVRPVRSRTHRPMCCATCARAHGVWPVPC